MELKPGYKQTKVGVIPEHWDAGYLGEKTKKVGSGITPTGGERIYKNEGRPFLRSQNVGWGQLLLEDIAFISDEIHETFKATEIEADDVFLNITGASIGRSALADARVVRGNVNQHVCIIRTKQEQLHPRFLNYFLLSSVGQQQIDSFQTGGNRQGLNFGQIRSFRLPIPPLPEQEAIATTLSDVGALIESLDNLIAKKRDIKQAAMQQLLSGKLRLPGFSEDWEIKRLGDICGRVTTGKLDANASIEDAEYPFFTCAKEHFFIDRYAFDADALLVSGNGANVGYVHHYKGKFNAYQRTYVLTDFNAETLYLKQVLDEYLRQRIRTEVNAGNTPYIKMDTLTNMSVVLPSSREEQAAIAALLSDMEAEVAGLESKRDKTHALKQGMMQELLTGRTRLI
ncbi:MAG: restriction endonuclease subunit S [Thermoleophilia bacterium]